MFGLNKYINKISQIKWKFNDSEKKDLEELFCVEFKKDNEGFYRIEKIIYTYVDIVSGLEEVDFRLVKTQDNFVLTIL